MIRTCALSSRQPGGTESERACALRYARLYYSEPVGSIDFNDDTPPSYRDFVCVAVTVGMTSQVSDTSFSAARLRSAAIRVTAFFAAVSFALVRGLRRQRVSVHVVARADA